MLDIPPSTPTRQLFEDFVEQLSQLASLEARLFRAELRETSSKLVSAVGLTAVAIILALGGLLTLLAAAALFLSGCACRPMSLASLWPWWRSQAASRSSLLHEISCRQGSGRRAAFGSSRC